MAKENEAVVAGGRYCRCCIGGPPSKDSCLRVWTFSLAVCPRTVKCFVAFLDSSVPLASSGDGSQWVRTQPGIGGQGVLAGGQSETHAESPGRRVLGCVGAGRAQRGSRTGTLPGVPGTRRPRKDCPSGQGGLSGASTARVSVLRLRPACGCDFPPSPGHPPYLRGAPRASLLPGRTRRRWVTRFWGAARTCSFRTPSERTSVDALTRHGFPLAGSVSWFFVYEAVKQSQSEPEACVGERVYLRALGVWGGPGCAEDGVGGCWARRDGLGVQGRPRAGALAASWGS